ncbi:MAG: hypothetical protein Q4C60_01165, partial [Eubacteriales bacterium]|nr:hypothetical protein [Eubacteriales bacterium]
TVPAFVTRVRERAFRRAALRSLCFYDNQVFFEGDALKECASLEELTILDNKGDDKERNSKNRDNKKEPGTSLLCTLYIPPLAYRKEEFCRLLYCGPFDFAGYDALFPTYYTEPYDMMRMACCRLLHPVSLPQRQEQEYRGYLERNAIQLLSAIAKKDDPDALQTLLSLSVLSPEELDEGIELLNRLRKPILLQLLMQYKYEHGREQSFSYEL